MKYTLIFVLIAILTLACSTPKSSKSTKDISVAEATKLIESNANLILLDVRTPEEWSQGSIEGATKINFFDSDFSDKLTQLDNSSPVLVYCKSGGRSAKATLILEKAGFNEVYNLLGGYNAYSKN